MAEGMVSAPAVWVNSLISNVYKGKESKRKGKGSKTKRKTNQLR
jgi:hypothetical protein